MNINSITTISLNLLFSNFNEIEKEYFNQFETLKYINHLHYTNSKVIEPNFKLPNLTELFDNFNEKIIKLSIKSSIQCGAFKSKILFGRVEIPWIHLHGSQKGNKTIQIIYPSWVDNKFILLDDETIHLFLRNLIKYES